MSVSIEVTTFEPDARSPRHPSAAVRSTNSATSKGDVGTPTSPQGKSTSPPKAGTPRTGTPKAAWKHNKVACLEEHQQLEETPKVPTRKLRQQRQEQRQKRQQEAVEKLEAADRDAMEAMYVGNRMTQGTRIVAAALRQEHALVSEFMPGLAPTAMEGLCKLTAAGASVSSVIKTWWQVLSAVANLFFIAYNFAHIPDDSDQWDCIRLTRIVVAAELAMVLLGFVVVCLMLLVTLFNKFTGRSSCTAATYQMFATVQAGIVLGQVNCLYFLALIPGALSFLAQRYADFIRCQLEKSERSKEFTVQITSQQQQQQPDRRFWQTWSAQSLLLLPLRILRFLSPLVLLVALVVAFLCIVFLGLAGLLVKLALVSNLAGTTLAGWGTLDILRYFQIANNIGSIVTGYELFIPERLFRGLPCWDALFVPHDPVASQPAAEAAGKGMVQDPVLEDQKLDSSSCLGRSVTAPGAQSRSRARSQPMDVAVHLAIHTHGWFQGFPMMQNLEDRDVLRAFIRQPMTLPRQLELLGVLAQV